MYIIIIARRVCVNPRIGSTICGKFVIATTLVRRNYAASTHIKSADVFKDRYISLKIEYPGYVCCCCGGAARRWRREYYLVVVVLYHVCVMCMYQYILMPIFKQRSHKIHATVTLRNNIHTHVHKIYIYSYVWCDCK